MQINDTSKVCRLFFQQGEVVEIRAIGLTGKNSAWDGWSASGGVVFGYFNKVEEFDKAAQALDNAGASGVYFTLNPCTPALIARANNRLVAAGRNRPLTGDSNIKYIRWLPIDIDPKRPAGISSSKAELGAAKETGKSIVTWLKEELGFPAFIGACSGNGYHILYRLPDPEPSDAISGSKGLIANALRVLNDRFGNDDVGIDISVHNPSRIWKLYGSTARKGDHTNERPHRRSHLFDKNPKCLNEVPVLPLAKLKMLAAQAPEDAVGDNAVQQIRKVLPAPSTKAMHPNDLGSLDVKAYLSHYGIPIQRIKEQAGATFYCLEQCIFDVDHRGGEAAIVASPEPPFLAYQCFRSSCKDKRWRDARACISGHDTIALFFSNYDPDWKPATAIENGFLNRIEFTYNTTMPNSSDVQPPDKIDPLQFYQKRGRREVFAVALMAKYLAVYLSPICYTDGVFWKYTNGLREPFKRNRINNIVHHALKDRIQTAWYKNSCEALAALTNREEEEWARSDNLVNLANGIYDLKKGALIQHHPKFDCRSQVPTGCNPEASCLRWQQFLKEIFDGDAEKGILLQEYLGYVLMPTCRYEKALFMYGTGANGKSTVIKILEVIIGKNNISHLTLDDLSNRFQIAFLKGKMVNLAAEVDTNARAGTEVLKMAISGDTLEGDQKFGHRITFESRVKFIFAMNSPPVIADKAHGFSRKVIVLNFNRRFAPEEMDRNLINKLIEEKEGILAWMLEGAKRLMQNDAFSIGEGIDQATHNFMASMNPVLAFLEEKCCQGAQHKVPAPLLFAEYKAWSADSAHKPLSKSRFYEQIINLCDHVKEKTRIDWNGSRPRGFIGIGLTDP